MTKITSFRLSETCLKALDEMCKERGYRNRTEAIEVSVIRTYMVTHTDKDWDNLIKYN